MISPVRKVYSTAQALGWALDLASALEYLHGRSPMVLHRDVKLSNVVLVEEEGGLVAKLADMGLHTVSWRRLL
jgi:serine/threonine protein kinase